MGSAMSIGMMMGGLNAASSLVGAAGQSSQMRAQANAQKAQAAIYEQQARQTEEQGRIEAENIDARKSKLRKQFEDTQAANRSLLAVGNVDMTSGSALDNSQGNINSFAADMSENAYAKALKEWETQTSVNRLKTEAGNARAQADAFSRASYNAFPSLLNAAISGASGFASGYSMAGGSLKSLWGGAEKTAKAGGK